MRQDYISRDSGVSESIGFLLIFTIVIMGIGLVTLYGYPLLLQQQTGADEQIMEKNMIVLQNDFKGLAYKTVPYKETSLKIGGGSLSVNKIGPKFRIEDSNVLLMDYYNTGDLRYQSTASQAEISLQNGAVVKRDLSGSSGSVMLAEPRWFYDSTTQTMVINVINVSSDISVMSREGIGTVQMGLGEADYAVYPSVGGNMVKITYIPDSGQNYEEAWRNYFEKSLKMTCNVGPLTCNTNSATHPVTRLVIKKTVIKINSI